MNENSAYLLIWFDWKFKKIFRKTCWFLKLVENRMLIEIRTVKKIEWILGPVAVAAVLLLFYVTKTKEKNRNIHARARVFFLLLSFIHRIRSKILIFDFWFEKIACSSFGNVLGFFEVNFYVVFFYLFSWNYWFLSSIRL